MSLIPLSLYVHFPWCVKKCPYCDFNSHTVRGEIPEGEYVDALIKNFEQQLQRVNGRNIDSVFIGGGTPSLISPFQILRLMQAVQSSGRLKPSAEVTLEANPGAIDEANFEAYLTAGINRLSIGVQSFNPAHLKKIGRIHSAEQANTAIDQAKRAGFKRINLDLMYGLPNQTEQQALADIEQALGHQTSHLSVYQLTLEPNTEFAIRPPKLPDSELSWAMQVQAQSILQMHGFIQYEVSAYSDHSPCQHNLNYWQFGDYLAIGAGAHGKVSDSSEVGGFKVRRFWNHRHPKAYLQAAKTSQFTAQTKAVKKVDRTFEFLMNALRLKAGFSLAQFETRTQGDVQALLDLLKPFIQKGCLEYSGVIIKPTELGYRYLDSILLACLPEGTP